MVLFLFMMAYIELHLHDTYRNSREGLLTFDLLYRSAIVPQVADLAIAPQIGCNQVIAVTTNLPLCHS